MNDDCGDSGYCVEVEGLNDEFDGEGICWSRRETSLALTLRARLIRAVEVVLM